MIDSMPCPRVLCHDFHSHFGTITSQSQSQCKCNQQCILILLQMTSHQLLLTAKHLPLIGYLYVFTKSKSETAPCLTSWCIWRPHSLTYETLRQLHMFQKVEYGGGLIFKVVLECYKRCSEPFLIYIYGIQCDFMPKSC